MASDSSSFDSSDVQFEDLLKERLSSLFEDCLPSFDEIQDLFNFPMNSQHTPHPSFTQAQGHPSEHPHPISVQQHDYHMRKDLPLPMSNPSIVSRESADPRRRGVGPGPYPPLTCFDPHSSGQTHVQPHPDYGWPNCSSPELISCQEALNPTGHNHSAYREMQVVPSVTRNRNITMSSYPCNSGREHGGAASMSGGYQLSYAPPQFSGQGRMPFENSFGGTSLALSDSHSHHHNVARNASLDSLSLISSGRVVLPSVTPSSNPYYDVTGALSEFYAPPVTIDPALLTLAPQALGTQTHLARHALDDAQLRGLNRDSAAPARGRAAHRHHTAPVSFSMAQHAQGSATPVEANSIQMGSTYPPPPPRFQGSSPPRPPQAPDGSFYNQKYTEALRRQKYPKHTWSGDSGVEFGVTRSYTVESSAAWSPPTANFRALELHGSLQPHAELEELSQELYKDGNKMPDPSVFSVTYGSDCRVAMLLQKDLSGVPDPDDTPLSLRSNRGPLSLKPSFRMEFRDYPKYNRQVNAARSTNGHSIPPTKGRLAFLAARELQKFLDKCKRERNPFRYSLDELYLLSIDCVSSGSLQPRFGVRKSSGCGSVSHGGFA